MLKYILCATAAFALSGAAAHAADSDLPTKSIVVDYNDLDLSHKAGAETMLRRITNAAHEVCGPAPDNRELSQRSDYDACVRAARESAVDNLHAPVVSALAGRNPAPISVANRSTAVAVQ